MDDDNLTVFKMKRGAASQLNKSFVSAIRKENLSLDDAYEMLAIFFLNTDVIESWTELLHMKHDNCEDYLSEEERRDFIGDCVSEFAQFRDRLDPTSRLLLGGASPTLPQETTYWSMTFPNILISNLKKGGTYGCIYGIPRSGKTSLAVNFMELFIADTQLHILTNIVLKEELEQIHFCPTLSELVKQIAENQGWIAILDETATFVQRKRALSSENIDFENLGRFIGKLGGRLVMICHDINRDIPPILQSWMTEMYRKIDLENMIAILNKQGGLRMNRIISHIPDCNFSFLTEDIASLKFDISIKDLLSDIQTHKGTERDEQRNAILSWLKDHEQSGTEKKKAEATAMDRAKDAFARFTILTTEKGFPKMKAYRQIGIEMGLSTETIRQYIGWLSESKRYDYKKEDDGESIGVADEVGEPDEEEEDEVPK